MNVRRTLALAPLALFATLAACSSTAPSPADRIAAVAQRVIDGKASDASQNGVVLIIHYDPSSDVVEGCTGSMLAPDLVLTARHCTATTDEEVACDGQGNALAGGTVSGNFAASSLYIFTGATRPNFDSPNITPDGTGAKIYNDGAKNLCNHDIALIRLAAPIPNQQIVPIRLDSDVTTDDVITAVGWGVTQSTPEPTTRQQRSGIKIIGVGPDENLEPPVAPNEFEVGEAICSGDSGGPALDANGAILGVVSRGGNGTQPSQSDPAAGCVGTDAQNLYTKVAPFKDLILQAYSDVGQDPWLEGQPNPLLAKPGDACAQDSDCQSSICLADSSQKGALVCMTDCSTTACPTGQTCKTVSGAQICESNASANHATTTTTTGCSASPGDSGPNGLAFGIALALAVGGVAARRRRR